jgi:hypothetical protein
VFDPDDPESVLQDDPRPIPSAEALRTMNDDELARWIDHRAAQDAIVREMLRRDPSRFAAAIARALRLLAPAATADLAAPLTAAGDALGDMWVELLSSRRAHARVLAGVATSAIHLRRGLNPLIARAVSREESEWKLFAWAAGEFGAAAAKAVARMDEADPDRVAWILAHAVRAGGGREVEKIRTTEHGAIADAATRAVGRVDEARAVDSSLRQGAVGSTDGEKLASQVLSRIGSPAERPKDTAAL